MNKVLVVCVPFVLFALSTALAAQGEHAAEEHHGYGLLWPTINFLILVGAIYYFFAGTIREHFQSRLTGIRKDLVEAADLRATATAQLAEIDRKVKALPGEIDALRARGAEEIAAEERRIAEQAAAERERLLEQTRREIDVQLRIAKRDLLEHAADLSVQLASERIAREITPADQEHLVDRYLGQLQSERTDHQG